MIKTRKNRVFYKSPADAYDKYIVPINVQDSFEPNLPSFFAETNSPPIFEDEFSCNMSRANVPLRVLVDIHTGKYIYELLEPEIDVPIIVDYLTWFIDFFSNYELDKEHRLVIQKITQVRDFYKKWRDNVEAARKREEAKKKPKLILFNGGNE